MRNISYVFHIKTSKSDVTLCILTDCECNAANSCICCNVPLWGIEQCGVAKMISAKWENPTIKEGIL